MRLALRHLARARTTCREACAPLSRQGWPERLPRMPTNARDNDKISIIILYTHIFVRRFRKVDCRTEIIRLVSRCSLASHLDPEAERPHLIQILRGKPECTGTRARGGVAALGYCFDRNSREGLAMSCSLHFIHNCQKVIKVDALLSMLRVSKAET